jgi:pimeloyl-ACP methyl ester carboxylesterase
MPTVKANDINIYYETAGTGEPLVLISGLGYGLWQWHKMIPLLAEHFQVIVFDNRGAGGTDKPSGPYNVQMLAADTVGLLEAIDVDKVIIMGHSMGGFVAQEIAINYPQYVSKLVLSSTNFGGPNHVPVTPEAMQVLSDRSGDPVDLVKRGVAIATAPGFTEANPAILQELIDYRLSNPVPPEAYQAQMGVGMGLLSEEAAFEKRLKNVTVPTLILFGEHDKVVPPANAELLDKELPNSTVKILPDAGHIYPMEVPEAATQAVVEFAKS